MRVGKFIWLSLLLCVVLRPWPASSQALAPKLGAAQAKDHIGEQATVCGKVASTRYAATARGKPTFINLDKPYPNPIFTILIWGDNRDRFGTPEEKYRDKQVCVTGNITEYRGAPEIVVSDPRNIELEK